MKQLTLIGLFVNLNTPKETIRGNKVKRNANFTCLIVMENGKEKYNGSWGKFIYFWSLPFSIESVEWLRKSERKFSAPPTYSFFSFPFCFHLFFPSFIIFTIISKLKPSLITLVGIHSMVELDTSITNLTSRIDKRRMKGLVMS